MRPPSHLRARTRRRGTAWAAAVLAAVGLAAAQVPAGAAGDAAAAAAAGRPTFHNAVSDSFSDTFADPSVIRGRDGWWYAYATSDPLRAGDVPGAMHIARTRDWSSWEYLGTVFDGSNRPSWATPTAGLWAPDIRYVAGRYVLYFTVTDTTLHPGDDSAIGAATAPTPSGPWTPAPAPAVPPRPAAGGGFLWTFDPAGFTDTGGQRYLYYGSYFGGLWATRMSADGLTPVGTPTQVAIDNRYEGSYVVRHGDWYYLMGSAANCCAGPTTGYSVFAGRSRSPLGPFVDAEGTSLLASRVGGTPVLTQNGNRFVGAGHHAVVTDAEGRDFIAYHAIDRDHPWLAQPFGINRRPMLLDRLDWVDGWPRTRAGAGPSDTEQPAPSLSSGLGITPTDPAATGFRGLSAGPGDPVTGATALVHGTASTTSAAPVGALHVRLDQRGTDPLRVMAGRDRSVKVTLDPKGARLTAQAGGRGVVRSSATTLPPLPAGAWRTLTVEATAEGLTAEVTESDLADVAARVHLDGDAQPDPAPVRLSSSKAVVDNVVVNPAAADAPTSATVPQAGALIESEDFDDTSLAGFTWVRRNPAVTVSGGSLHWPVEGTDLVGGGNTASVLLHSTPGDGDWIAEAKTTLDLGVDTVRNYQQVGLVAYENDDDFARLSKVAIWNTRQTEFGRETAADPTNPGGPTSYGGAIVGTAAPTLWLRLAHHTSASGEHLYRAGTSRDGVHWTWGATWTFRPGTNPRIGLVAHGGASPAAVATVDHLRFYASTWPSDPGAG
ncbi:family 43 glycosylhydrolase [Intrasporangium flavum]|uniref:family 43 glycosylhydrolase n=1 Tax=Intrasporangium flavum TaxID=1428657 RepID=UPI0009FADF73|nr:family 43 glycosylhydrolase [Intrasporangium flavum]